MIVGISTSVVGRGKTGIAQYLFGLVRALAAHPEHRYVLFVLEGDAPLFEFARDYATVALVPERFRPPWRDILWHQIRLPRLARSLGVDAIHTPSYRRMIWSRSRIRVATIHDLAPCMLSHKYNAPRMFYARVVARQLARRQDQIIAVSQQTVSDIRRFFAPPPNRLSCVLNGIDHSRFHPTAREREPFLLYVARLEHPAKNHCRLIAAFNQFKAETKSNWKLVLAGSDWQDAEVIHRAAAQSPFARDIRLPGFVRDAELPEMYRAASAFIYPSLYEGFGLPPIEAMACGCPVIASDRGALGEVLGGAAQIIDPENVNAIAGAIARFWREPGLRASAAAAGLRRAADFDWAKTAAATLQVYERAASGTLQRRDASDKIAV